MNLEIGKTYLTRKGLKVTIKNRCNTAYPFLGVSGKSEYYYSETGKFDGDNPSDFDLICPVFNPNDAKEVISFVVSNHTLNDTEIRELLQAVAV